MHSFASIAQTAPTPSPPLPGELLAALDLGTNNCRLLVARCEDDGFVVVDSFSRIVRLGEGLARTGRLSERAMSRTVAALRVCARIIARHRVARVRCVATEACRRARNGAAFLGRVERATGLRLEILGNEEEARLALLACLPLVEPGTPAVLMADIGGGSTELVWLARPAPELPAQIALTTSVPLGVVTLSETFGPEPDAAAYAAMVEAVETRLAAIERTHGIGAQLAPGPMQMLGTSGTVTTLAAIHLGLRHYDRRRVDGLRVHFSALDAVAARLRGMTNVERLALPCIGSGRADLVVAGCAVLDALHRTWPIGALCVADRGVREGILTTLSGSDLATRLAMLD